MTTTDDFNHLVSTCPKCNSNLICSENNFVIAMGCKFRCASCKKYYSTDHCRLVTFKQLQGIDAGWLSWGKMK